MAFGYNHLNLPDTAWNGTVNVGHLYDAMGTKLRKYSNQGGDRDYVGGIEYGSSGIELIHTGEGVAYHNGGTYTYRYNLTDHLGNVRTTLYRNPSTSQVEVLQSDDYYPFGKQYVVSAGDNKYLYNGKELQGELGGQYDYGARFYDTEIGRWNVVDPRYDFYYHYSPYAYVMNSPIMHLDPNGEFAGTVSGLIIGAIAGFVDAWLSDADLTPGIVRGALAGAVAGAAFDLTVATFGGAPATVVGAGVVSGMVGSAAAQFMESGSVSLQKTAIDGAVGGVAGYAGSKASPYLRKGGEFVANYMRKEAAKTVVHQADNMISAFSNEAAKGGAGAYDGVRAASNYLQAQGVPRAYRKQILESFEVGTISLRTADNATFGLRFYGGAANQNGRYLFPTFTNYTNRAGLALPPSWNSMSGISQFQIAPGSTYIFGRAASQGGIYGGGSYQMYINNLNNLIK